METKALVCCICHRLIPAKGNWTGGNNADPIVPDGRCCDECDQRVVIPARIREMRQAEREP